jgi:glucosamine-6-phosphate deaminase
MITASALQLHRDAVVIVDREAASELKMVDYYEWIQEKRPDAP